MTFDRTVPATSRESEERPELPELPHLFLVLECQRPSAGGMRFALDGLESITIGRGAGRTRTLEGGSLRVDVPDGRMSSRHATIRRSGDGYIIDDLGSTNGTKVDGAKVERAELRDGCLIELGSSVFTLRWLPTPPRDQGFVDGERLVDGELGLATLLPEYSATLLGLTRVAMSGVSVLLLGESGTGKEVLARVIHAVSMRRGAFVPVNCGALPETLVEAQLFGHAKGAFSGATRDEPGLVRASDGGTLFLDEIGDLPKPSQAALLRVLQEHEVMPVGATRAVKVDLRVVAATHRDVHTSSEFRPDLYARLAGFTFDLPPLRERREDLGVLIAGILGTIAKGRDVALTTAAGVVLFRYAFPLNVRELHQALSVALVLAEENLRDGRPTIDVAHLPESIRRPPSVPPPRVAKLSSDDEALKQSLLAALTTHKGNVSIVAREMTKTRMQIHRWMKRFGIDPDTFR